MTSPMSATGGVPSPGWREIIAATPFLGSISDRIKEGKRVELAGLPGSMPAVLLASVVEENQVGMLAVFPEPDDAEAAALDFASLMEISTVSHLPPWPFDPYDELIPSPALSFERLDALLHLSSLEKRGGVVVTSAPALALWSADGDELQRRGLRISEGMEMHFEGLITGLLERGFERVVMVEGPGEFAVRGGLVDISPPDGMHGVRVEFWGDTVESLREFSLRDQRTVGGIGNVTIPAVREAPTGADAIGLALERSAGGLDEESIPDTPLGSALEREQFRGGLEWYMPLLVNRPSSVADLLPENCLVAVWEPERSEEELCEVHRRARENYERIDGRQGWLSPDKVLTPDGTLRSLRDSHPGVDLVVAASPGVEVLRTDAGPLPAIKGDFDTLREELRRLQVEGVAMTVLVEDEEQLRRLEDLLPSEPGGGPQLALGTLNRGFVWRQAGIAVWPDHEIFSRPRRSRPPRIPGGQVIRSYHALNYGDLVVHVDHGIGRYEGLRAMEVDSNRTELLELTYAKGDKLLVPIDQMARVQRYVGADDETAPQLNILGGTRWERTMGRARVDLMEIAKDLARLYAVRSTISGKVYPADDILMEELEASFPYTETSDQARAVEEVKSDLESEKPMDRLICGDVGYGKTEVAIRAALKVIEGGDQVAVLVPTTVLAQQHLETFRRRLESFPVRVEMLSRFRTPVQQRNTLEGLASGDIDLVIGTHRLLSGDVSFARPGLIVVDEEHRFGVKAKEALKSIRAEVGVLSLTATPIPRTLHMSLAGIRDISIINTPPEDRLPVHTEVVEFDEDLIRSAIRSEKERGGQVFFVHNRVQSIDSAVSLVERLVPEANIGVAHGQMNARRLERVMLEFAAGAIDVLVSTMIIESGLDLPNANTLIVNRADRFGLAQLYQLRGRVGRSSKKAYAYFLVPPGKRLTGEARRRLQAVQEYSDLGAGFQLAMRDLEIRGAGNLLGAQQHGHITSVGLDLYTEMLEEAVAEIEGRPESIWSPPRMEMPAEAFLPESYVPLPGLRLGFYRRAVDARSLEDIVGLQTELRDRFGPLPAEAGALLDASILRIAGAELGLDSLVVQGNRFTGQFRMETGFDRTAWESVLERLGGGVRFSGKAPLRFEVEIGPGDPFERTREARNILLTEEEAEYVTGPAGGTIPVKGMNNE